MVIVGSSFKIALASSKRPRNGSVGEVGMRVRTGFPVGSLKVVVDFLVFSPDPVTLRRRIPPLWFGGGARQLDGFLGEGGPFVPKARKRQIYPKPT
jgi:hypothetical protein